MKWICPVGKGEVDQSICLPCAQNKENDCGYGYVLLKKMLIHEPRPEVHVTDLTGCIRKSALDKRENTPRLLHDSLVPALGIGVHEWVEDNDDWVKSEIPVVYDGIHGRIDAMYNDGTIQDMKTTRWLSDRLPYTSHVMQVNVYGYLARKLGMEVNRLEIQYVDMVGPTRCRAHKKVYQWIDGAARCPVCNHTTPSAHFGASIVEVPIWSDERVEGAIKQRAADLQRAIDNPDFTPDGEPSFICDFCSHVSNCSWARTE